MEKKKRNLIIGLFICFALNIILFTYIYSLKNDREYNVIEEVKESYSLTDSSVPGYPFYFKMNDKIKDIELNVTKGTIINWEDSIVIKIGTNYKFDQSKNLYFSIDIDTIIDVKVNYKNNDVVNYQITFIRDKNNNYKCKIKKVN